MIKLILKVLVPHANRSVFVLECDDSQGNVLANNAWVAPAAPANWTETLTCSGTGDKQVYSSTRKSAYFKYNLPGTKMGNLLINYI